MAKIHMDGHETHEETSSTVMSPDIVFTGKVEFKNSLMVKGKVQGSIKAEGHLIIAPGAVVEAEIVADKVTNYGSLTGNLSLSDSLEMKKGALQKGNVSTPNIMVEYGCKIDGLVRMDAV